MIFPPCILSRYDTEHMAARAYDLAALKYRGLATHINFSVSVMQKFLIHENWIFNDGLCNIGFITSVWQVENYRDELEQMKSMTKQEFVQHSRM